MGQPRVLARDAAPLVSSDRLGVRRVPRRKYYEYARPLDGQLEERWWAGLEPATQTLLLAEVRMGIKARRDAWNASHPPERHIPRPPPRVGRPEKQPPPGPCPSEKPLRRVAHIAGADSWVETIDEPYEGEGVR